METDWEEGPPPKMLEIDAFIQGRVRRGWREGSYFVPIDCNHPLANMTIDINLVTHWRARNSIVVIQQGSGQSNYAGSTYRRDLSGFFEGALGNAAHGLFGGLFTSR
jgi:hypothetical protein